MKKNPQQLIGYSLRELISLTGRLGEKMLDKYLIWSARETEQAKGYLIYFRDTLKNNRKKQVLYNEIFGQSGDFFEVTPFKRGYNTKSVTFKTVVGSEVKRWVLKIGHRISPVVDFGDPSSPEYSKKYLEYLDILEKQIIKKKKLSFLLPKPQEVFWACLTENGNQFGTTLIVQPFMHVVAGKKLKEKISQEKKDLLIEEFIEFKHLCVSLMKEHFVRPDLLGEGNLAVARFGEEYHLVLLDVGLLNLNAPLPITQTVMHFASIQTLTSIEYEIRNDF